MISILNFFAVSILIESVALMRHGGRLGKDQKTDFLLQRDLIYTEVVEDQRAAHGVEIVQRLVSCKQKKRIGMLGDLCHELVGHTCVDVCTHQFQNSPARPANS